MMDDDNSALGHSRFIDGLGSNAGLPYNAAVDDGTYVFKFRTPSGRTHRFQSRHDNYEHMREIISNKLALDPFFTSFEPKDEFGPRPDPSDYQLAYTDADEDVVLITSDSDVTDAVRMARSKNLDRVVLFIQGGKGWDDASAEKVEVKATETGVTTAREEVPEVEKIEAVPTPPAAAAPPPRPDDVFGIPRDMLLPVSIGVLAASIVIVFTISKVTSNNSY
jgi:hypothetical protein